MFTLFQAEWFKLRKTNILPILFTGPIVGILIGLFANTDMFPDEANQWTGLLLVMNLTYALLFLPLVTGILAATICRYEHQAGGWKQLLSLPVSREQVFVTKYFLLVFLILVIQLLYFLSFTSVGLVRGLTDTFPMAIVWKSIVGGWIATFPLAALQLWMSTMFKSFAASFSVNVIFTLPAILAINSAKFGPYYPWAQPFSMMYVGGDTTDVFFIPWEQLLTVVGGSFLVFFIGGYIYFKRKPI
ncbi:ABC transporter permease [Ornithinibacillus scapharcae]|uniref:ABC transporter permease n=1 Tax=Ornithinibacillus scapharcae TaxID=1147159 RepID=UPI000225B8F5|nr:ABC transporter permease [Ornithinibacillus scapharcae]